MQEDYAVKYLRVHPFGRKVVDSLQPEHSEGGDRAVYQAQA